jgi:hypothetical protein
MPPIDSTNVVLPLPRILISGSSIERMIWAIVVPLATPAISLRISPPSSVAITTVTVPAGASDFGGATSTAEPEHPTMQAMAEKIVPSIPDRSSRPEAGRVTAGQDRAMDEWLWMCSWGMVLADHARFDEIVSP